MTTKIANTKENIERMLKELYVIPRDLITKWSRITNQTAQTRLAYLGQHLASMVTGIPGVGTAARGDDLEDGTEVKCCSRADQLGICKNCDARVMRVHKLCPKCGSDRIAIKEDSHWIFSIKSKAELDRLLANVPRVLLILFDRDECDNICVRIWQVDPKDAYARNFFTSYYSNIFLTKLKKRESGIAPCNLHPLQYDFYMMNPVLICRALICGDVVNVDHLNLSANRSEPMPSSLLQPSEREVLIAKLKLSIGRKKISARDRESFERLLPTLDADQRRLLAMRSKVGKKNKGIYQRASQRH